MTERLDDLGRGFQALLSAQDEGFVSLVIAAGLSPASDFRLADLSGADLRHQDLRAFDLSFARFDGTLVHGAAFNDTVSQEQLQSAVTDTGDTSTAAQRLLFIGKGARAAMDDVLEILGERYRRAERLQGHLDLYLKKSSIRSLDRPRRKSESWPFEKGDVIADLEKAKALTVFAHIENEHDALALLQALALQSESGGVSVFAFVVMGGYSSWTLSKRLQNAGMIDRYRDLMIMVDGKTTLTVAEPASRRIRSILEDFRGAANFVKAAEASELASSPGGAVAVPAFAPASSLSAMPVQLLRTDETSREKVARRLTEMLPSDDPMGVRRLRALVLQSGRHALTALHDFNSWHPNALTEARAFGGTTGPRQVYIAVAEAESSFWHILPQDVTARLSPSLQARGAAAR